jgi:uncharacterized phage infection (PIP) family protein YhgE
VKRSSPFACLTLILTLFLTAVAASAQRRDYLTSLEGDKIRDAETSADRIKLFVAFAADRLKKFHYELGKASTDKRRADRLNGLLVAYTGCIDDAAELLSLGVEKQEDIRKGIKEMQDKGKGLLAQLEQLAAGGSEIDSYKDTLSEAIAATKDALQEADKAAKEIAPPPARRRN